MKTLCLAAVFLFTAASHAWATGGPSHNNGDYDISVGGTERMRVMTSSGAVGIGTSAPNASALIDATSTTLGFLPPRMTSTQRDAISSPAAGLEIFNTSTSTPNYYNGTAWTAVSSGGGGGSSVNIQSFTTSGTWTKPSGATLCRVLLIGGGSGGSSGATGTTSASIYGGGGGSPGAIVTQDYAATDLPSPLTVSIGAGGSGGAAVSGTTVNGSLGNGGSMTTIANSGGTILLTAIGGTVASAYSAGGSSFGSSNGATGFGGTGSSSSNSTTLSTAMSQYGFLNLSGAGGGNFNASVINNGGSAGYVITGYNFSTSTSSGSYSVSAGGNGVTFPGTPYGSGGGGGIPNASANGGAGGNGGNYGGGGGGGAAARNGYTSGAGGTGGAGFARITCW